MKLSVIVPVYNGETYLEESLDAILQQTFKDFELICVDDGSKDHSMEILERYAAQDSRITILKQQNQYAGVARNNGFQHSSGEYVIFLDSDDYFYPSMFEEMLQASEKVDAEVCICGWRSVYPNGHYICNHDYLDGNWIPDKECFSSLDVADRIFQLTAPPAWNKMFRRDFIEKNHIQFMTCKSINDFFFTYKALTCAQRITVVKRCLLDYRRDVEGSITLSINYTKEHYFYDVIKAQREDLIQRGVEDVFRRSFLNRALHLCLHNLSLSRSKEEYLYLYNLIKKEINQDVGFTEHGRKYWYNKKFYTELLYILENPAEKGWERREQQLLNASVAILPQEYEMSLTGEELQGQENIKVSVIIPVYNTEAYLDDCLSSVCSQSLQGLEIICVDDGSTDSSAAVLEKWAALDKRVIILHQEHKGTADARNAGMRIANGEYIHFLDSDDTIHPQAYEVLFSELKKNPLDMLLFGAYTVYDPLEMRYEKDVYWPEYIRKNRYDSVQEGAKLFVAMSENNECASPAMLYLVKRDFLKEHHLSFVNNTIHADEVFTVEALLLAKSAKYINVLLYNRKVRAGSVMTGETDWNHARGLMYSVKVLCDFYQEYRIDRDLVLAKAFVTRCRKMYRDSLKYVRKDPEQFAKLQEYVTELDMPMRYVLEMDFTMQEMQNKMEDMIAKRHEQKRANVTIKKESKKIQTEAKKTQAEIKKIKESKEYRIGRYIMYIPWKIRNLFSKK